MMPRAPRVKAKDVKVGDWILTGYHWRTWKQVTEIHHHQPICERDPTVMIDNTQCRTNWMPDELVACKPNHTNSTE